jgi:hypothetical protein
VAHCRLPKLKLTLCSQTDKSTPQQKRAKMEASQDLNIDLQMPGGSLAHCGIARVVAYSIYCSADFRGSRPKHRLPSVPPTRI